MDTILIGTVVAFDSRYGLAGSGEFTIVVDDPVPPYLKTIHLIARQVGRAHVGDRVELSYRSGAWSGEWYVSRVLGLAS
jgi:hypothetical protein